MSNYYPHSRDGDDYTSTPRAPSGPVFNNPFVNQPATSPHDDEIQTVDIADQHYPEPAEDDGYAGIQRVSVVPFAPDTSQQAYSSPRAMTQVVHTPQEDEERRGSDETLAEYVAPDDYPKMLKSEDNLYKPSPRSRDTPPRSNNSGPRRRSAQSSNAYARRDARPNDIENPASTSKSGKTAPPRSGFLGHAKDHFRQWARDPDDDLIDSARNSNAPSLASSRQNSYSGEQPSANDRRGSAHQDNFERSMAFNEDFEDTYLLDDDDGQHRSVREAIFHNPHLRLHHRHSEAEFEAYERGRRKSYSERRKREKHRIIHCAERK
jgi:hypothetical protein